MENKYNKVKCYSFLLLDLYASITPQLPGYKIHQGSATAIWQGAGWSEQGANFPSVKSCNYADAARLPRGANGPRSRRQSQPFMSSSAGSEANETVRLARLARPSPNVAQDHGVIIS